MSIFENEFVFPTGMSTAPISSMLLLLSRQKVSGFGYTFGNGS